MEAERKKKDEKILSDCKIMFCVGGVGGDKQILRNNPNLEKYTS